MYELGQRPWKRERGGDDAAVMPPMKSAARERAIESTSMPPCLRDRPILPSWGDVKRVTAIGLDELDLGGREPVLITGSNSFDSGKDNGRYLKPLTNMVARLVAEDNYLQKKIVLVGASAHGGISGKEGEAWDNVIQETFFETACKGNGKIPMIKVLFQDGPHEFGINVKVAKGEPNVMTVSLPLNEIEETNSSMPLRQGWKAALASVVVCFGGGLRARMLCGSRGERDEWVMRLKDSAFPVPAAGGLYHTELTEGADRDWRPKGLSEAEWQELLQVKEGDLEGKEFVSYAEKVVAAIRKVVESTRMGRGVRWPSPSRADCAGQTIQFRKRARRRLSGREE